MSQPLPEIDHESATGEEHHNEEAHGSMTVTFNVSASAFKLGRAMANAPVASIEFDPTISVGEPSHSQFWAATADSDVLQTVLSEVRNIATITSVADDDSRTLFAVEWAAPLDGLLGHLQTFDARLVDITGTSETWRFVCRFPHGEQLTGFHNACVDDGITVELTRVRQ